MTKTQSERLAVANEIKMNILEHNLEGDFASKVLWKILDRYVDNGNPVHTLLNLKGRYDRERMFVVDLYNDTRKRDVVLIRAKDK